MNPKVGIIGAGPAGCTLAILLKQRNIDCVVYDDDHKPDLIVGESLVSAVIPILRKLGIEDKVAAISTLKYGAALRHANGTRVDFRFQEFGSDYPAYSYNIPRPEFDDIIKDHAKSLGVKFVQCRAKVEKTRNDPAREIQLSDECLNAASLDRASQPDLLVDATGRARAFSRALKIPATKGNRNDVSYFAHYESFDADNVVPGQVVLSVLDCGWSWQIPVKDVLSVGVVLNKGVAKQYGSNAEERLEAAINLDPLLRKSGQNRRRVSDVKSYSNYQLISERGFGNGWVLLGDSFGFVDPMLSPGVFMGMESAVLLDKVISKKRATVDFNQSIARDLQAYSNDIMQWHNAWDSLISYFYDGRLLSMANVRKNIQQNSGRFSLPRLMEPKISRALSSLVSGIKTRSSFNQSVLMHSCKFMLKDAEESIQEHAIKTIPKESLDTKMNASKELLNKAEKHQSAA